MNRQEGIAGVRRGVVKLGTSLLTNADRALDADRVCALADRIAALWARGPEVAVVSSGAIGAGMTELGLARRPTVLAELQACAAVGQTKLKSPYEGAFRRHGLCVAQILLTHDDLSDRDRHLNARNTLDKLLARRVVPVINENDTVSVA
jgi:glutamate 5-kinase